jgi:hypothetical protein
LPYGHGAYDVSTGKRSTRKARRRELVRGRLKRGQTPYWRRHKRGGGQLRQQKRDGGWQLDLHGGRRELSHEIKVATRGRSQAHDQFVRQCLAQPKIWGGQQTAPTK